MPTGSEAFLELPIGLGFGPATGPTLKTALCHIRTLVGRRINNGSPPGKRFFILQSQGAFPPGFYLLRKGWVHCPTPEAPQKGNANGAEGIFWNLPDARGLRPCTRTHHKKALCHTCPFGGASNKHR